MKKLITSTLASTCLISATECEKTPFYTPEAMNKTKLVLYPGMEHRPIDPKMMLDLMEQNLAWFKQFLLEQNEK